MTNGQRRHTGSHDSTCESPALAAWAGELFACPNCVQRLEVRTPTTSQPSGFYCKSCGATYPVQRGILAFETGEEYAASFGRQWTRYEVIRPEEDLEVFKTKTGVDPEELGGLTVLDAGCGSGRYSRVVAEHGARVVGVDKSRAVEKAAAVCRAYPDVVFARADLLALPFLDATFDFVFSIGVIHHTSAPRLAFGQLARVVKPGGRLAVWVYRRNTWMQERINQALRGVTVRMDPQQLEQLCWALAVVGGIPVVRRTLNKLVNFSSHPDFELRVCDNFDWYACRYQFHYTEEDLLGWFREEGFSELRLLKPQKSGPFYDWAYRHNLLIGSGVNVIGRKD